MFFPGHNLACNMIFLAVQDLVNDEPLSRTRQCSLVSSFGSASRPASPLSWCHVCLLISDANVAATKPSAG